MRSVEFHRMWSQSSQKHIISMPRPPNAVFFGSRASFAPIACIHVLGGKLWKFFFQMIACVSCQLGSFSVIWRFLVWSSRPTTYSFPATYYLSNNLGHEAWGMSHEPWKSIGQLSFILYELGMPLFRCAQSAKPGPEISCMNPSIPKRSQDPNRSRSICAHPDAQRRNSNTKAQDSNTTEFENEVLAILEAVGVLLVFCRIIQPLLIDKRIGAPMVRQGAPKVRQREILPSIWISFGGHYLWFSFSWKKNCLECACFLAGLRVFFSRPSQGNAEED